MIKYVVNANHLFLSLSLEIPKQVNSKVIDLNFIIQTLNGGLD
jgi:hypothetical protein